MITAILGLGSALIRGVTGYFERKQRIKEAETENRARLLRDNQSNNHEWEMRQLANAGWKDDVLFYAIIGMYVYSAVDPVAATKVFTAWDQTMPEWFVKITFWLIASVLGVKKIGDYVPALLDGIKQALKK